MEESAKSGAVALVNAVYHKSYRKPEPIVVTFTREQMTITSMQGPDRSIKTADLKKLVLFSKGDRNRRVGEFLKEIDLAEARNTGYPVILNAVKTNGSPRPKLETNPHRDYFTFVLPIHELYLKNAELFGVLAEVLCGDKNFVIYRLQFSLVSGRIRIQRDKTEVQNEEQYE